jgi:hypothetical protein
MVCHIFWPKAKRSKATRGKRPQEQERATSHAILELQVPGSALDVSSRICEEDIEFIGAAAHCADV